MNACPLRAIENSPIDSGSYRRSRLTHELTDTILNSIAIYVLKAFCGDPSRLTVLSTSEWMQQITLWRKRLSHICLLSGNKFASRHETRFSTDALLNSCFGIRLSTRSGLWSRRTIVVSVAVTYEARCRKCFEAGAHSRNSWSSRVRSCRFRW
jgi:hypothetical protein